jgi:preprotein translocase subunit SecA
MDTGEPRVMIYEVIDEVVPKRVEAFLEVGEGVERDIGGLLNWVNTTFPLGLPADRFDFASRSVAEVSEFLIATIKSAYEQKASIEDPGALLGLERYIMLNAIDRLWQEHLYAMDGLREAVSLRAFGQKDPLVEYKNDGYAMFVELMESIKGEILNNLFRSTTNLQAFEKLLGSLPQSLQHAMLGGGELAMAGVAAAQPGESGEAGALALPRLELPIKRELPKVGRNEPCPCGSGRKFKSCCGRNA